MSQAQGEGVSQSEDPMQYTDRVLCRYPAVEHMVPMAQAVENYLFGFKDERLQAYLRDRKRLDHTRRWVLSSFMDDIKIFVQDEAALQHAKMARLGAAAAAPRKSKKEETPRSSKPSKDDCKLHPGKGHTNAECKVQQRQQQKSDKEKATAPSWYPTNTAQVQPSTQQSSQPSSARHSHSGGHDDREAQAVEWRNLPYVMTAQPGQSSQSHSRQTSGLPPRGEGSRDNHGRDRSAQPMLTCKSCGGKGHSENRCLYMNPNQKPTWTPSPGVPYRLVQLWQRRRNELGMPQLAISDREQAPAPRPAEPGNPASFHNSPRAVHFAGAEEPEEFLYPPGTSYLGNMVIPVQYTADGSTPHEYPALHMAETPHPVMAVTRRQIMPLSHVLDPIPPRLSPPAASAPTGSNPSPEAPSDSASEPVFIPPRTIRQARKQKSVTFLDQSSLNKPAVPPQGTWVSGSFLVDRDIDLLQELASRNNGNVQVPHHNTSPRFETNGEDFTVTITIPTIDAYNNTRDCLHYMRNDSEEEGITVIGPDGPTDIC